MADTQFCEALARSWPGHPGAWAREFFLTEGELYSGSLQTNVASTLNTEKNKKSKQPQKRRGREERREREISAGVVSKKGQGDRKPFVPQNSFHVKIEK